MLLKNTYHYLFLIITVVHVLHETRKKSGTIQVISMITPIKNNSDKVRRVVYSVM